MSTRVETTSGAVSGSARGAHIAYLGIPFAKPPLGALRFRPPQAPEPWPGTREACAFGPAAMQGAAFAPGVEVEGVQSEDCLYLNVFTRAPGPRKRPVLVWIHGGAFVVGSAGLPLYDGGALAELGDVVIVTLNYRLGSFGFLWLGEQENRRLDAAANLALLDQIAALEWVRDNIAGFGGDPAQVTLFGESAGGTSVCALLTAPRARGLFRSAIAQSSAITMTWPSHEHAARTGAALLARLGIAPNECERLRQLPAEQIAAAQREVEATGQGFLLFYPLLDPDSLPEHPQQALASPQRLRLPLLIGTNRDEWNLFDAPNIVRWGEPLAREELLAQVQRRLPSATSGQLAQLVDAYAASRAAHGLPHDARALLRAIDGDLRFRVPSLRFAEAYLAPDVPVYMYLFNYASPALRGALGACHALELPFVFGTLASRGQERFAGSGPVVQALSRSMMQSWLAFAISGAPEAEWPRYDLQRRPTRVYEHEPLLAYDPLGDERRAWDGLL
jgi:para-nitrobenzyl esterase